MTFCYSFLQLFTLFGFLDRFLVDNVLTTTFICSQPPTIDLNFIFEIKFVSLYKIYRQCCYRCYISHIHLQSNPYSSCVLSQMSHKYGNLTRTTSNQKVETVLPQVMAPMVSISTFHIHFYSGHVSGYIHTHQGKIVYRNSSFPFPGYYYIGQNTRLAVPFNMFNF